MTKETPPIQQIGHRPISGALFSVDLKATPESAFGSKYLLVCVDRYSAYVIAEPLLNKEANTDCVDIPQKLFYFVVIPVCY